MSAAASRALPSYEVFALRYASHPERRSGENYLGDDPHDDRPMPLDFYFWLIRDGARTVVVDTGCSAQTAARRARRYLRAPAELLARLEVAPDDVDDVVLTHLHYDHAGNLDLFPHAVVHLQEAEIAYCTGRCMCHATLRRPYEARDVAAVIERLYAGRLRYVDGDAELAPGLSLHRLGGHTAGLQVVRVHTARGYVVLASDAAHYWDHARAGRPFPIVLNVAEMLAAHERLRQLADGPDHVIPGHDPAVRAAFPAWRGDADVVALHLPPLRPSPQRSAPDHEQTLAEPAFG